MRKVKIAASQMSCTWNTDENIQKAEELVRQAAGEGANIILLQELFETPYFCQQQKFEYMKLATSVENNKAIIHMSKLAKELQVVIPVSFFERTENTAFNSVAVIDSDGTNLGIYRKTHIPDGLPYAEKFYFTPGDTGFRVWDTAYGKIGVGICWDQWFPEAARCMVLQGAEILFYPTAIGSEPTLNIDSKPHWQHCMQGHAAANMVPVVASNRIGTEIDGTTMTFYGSSFIADHHGNIMEEADRSTQMVLVQEVDLDQNAMERREWGIFRDRRPEMYQIIGTHGK